MATARLPGFTKVEIAHLAQVPVANPFGVSPHVGNDFLDLGHAAMIPLVVSFVKWRISGDPSMMDFPLLRAFSDHTKKTTADLILPAMVPVVGGKASFVCQWPRA